jgi:hypothetical protein
MQVQILSGKWVGIEYWRKLNTDVGIVDPKFVIDAMIINQIHVYICHMNVINVQIATF